MYTSQMTPGISFSELLSRKRPDAAAWITGNVQNPRLSGLVKFYRTDYGGVLVEAEVEFGDCSGDFSNTGSHYNPEKRPHPGHAGDLLPLPGSQGYAWSAFYDKRFTLDEIIGKSVIIHAGRDDFTTQPSGDSGTKIGCGEIRRMV